MSLEIILKAALELLQKSGCSLLFVSSKISLSYPSIFIACIYAVFRVYKAWRADTKTYETTKTIVNQITPHIEALSTQIAVLQQEVSDLKNELKSKK